MNKRTVLVVEDDPSIQALLKVFFNAKGFITLTASRGSTGLTICRQQRPDVVLLDVNLPDLDGYEVGRALRADPFTRTIPIVFLTARTQKQDRIRGLGEVGAEYYLGKPFDIDEVLVIVERLIQDTHARSSAHPITNLPSSALVNERLRVLLSDRRWALALAHLDGFEMLVALYGNSCGEELLHVAAGALFDSLDASQARGDFVGQMSTGPEFVIISTPERIKTVCEHFITTCDAALERALGKMSGHPWLRLSIGVLFDEDGPFADIRALTAAAEDTRRYSVRAVAEDHPRSYVNYGRVE